MKKVLHVALREFLATAATKGFIIGILISPLVILLMILIVPGLIKKGPPKVEGEVAVIDPTGQVTEGLRDYLKPENIVERREKIRKVIDEATPAAIRTVTGSSPQGRAAIQQGLDAALGSTPNLKVTALDASADVEQEKHALMEEAKGEGGALDRRLALAIVDPNAVVRASDSDSFGSYSLFVRSKLDDRIEEEIRDGMRDAIIAARVRASGLDRSLINALTRVNRPAAKTVTATGEQTTSEGFSTFLPMGFMILMMVAVITSGQYIITTTVEEKSNRVVEVLLSAVSPMQLMAGKILGQMAVGILILVLYAGLGMGLLVTFAVLGLLDLTLLFFLLIFFLLSFFTIASLMAAVGAAVNEMREAQTLMTPIMIIIMIPWMLWWPISRDPNSTFAVVTSFIPPLGNFVMLLRMTSSSPPPMWQVWLAILVLGIGAYGALWFAAKIFRVGLLMYGKPPSLPTLIRWARMS